MTRTGARDAVDRFSVPGLLLDGHSAAARPVTLGIDQGRAALTIAPAQGAALEWPLHEVRRIPDQADAAVIVLAHVRDPVARLMVDDAEGIRVLTARCPNLHRRRPVIRRGRVLAWALAAVGSVAAIIFLLVPLMAAQLAAVLPPKGEVALGDATLEQIRGALGGQDVVELDFCAAPEGLAALRGLGARLSEGLDMPYPLQIHVLDHDLVNAFALPGGHVVLFEGLLRNARHPDEMTGVLAHEIGHVLHRDPTRIALQSAGSIGVLGLLLGDFAGGFAVLVLANRLIQADYTRAAEARADAFASELLLAKGLNPAGVADFLDRLRDAYGEDTGLMRHFASHPALGDRAAAARAAAAAAGTGADAPPVPSLTKAEWAAVRDICL